MCKPTSQRDSTPEPLEYARATDCGVGVEEPKTPVAFVWLFGASLAMLAISAFFTKKAGGPFEHLLTEIFDRLDVAAIVVINVLAAWSWILLCRGYWRNTYVGFAAVVVSFLAILGDIGLVACVM